MHNNCTTKNIFIYKGTNKNFIIKFKVNRCPYDLEDDDILTMTILDYRDDNKVVIEKQAVGSNMFIFTPEDTEALEIGFYRYNIKFTQASTGCIYQIIAPSEFWIKAGE